jgi:hypothetical protein
MAKKKRIVRNIDQIIDATKLKLEKMEEKRSFLALKDAVKDGRVPKSNVSKYRSHLRDAKALEKAAAALERHGYKNAAGDVDKLRKGLVTELNSLLVLKRAKKKMTKKKSTKKKSKRKSSR